MTEKVIDVSDSTLPATLAARHDRGATDAAAAAADAGAPERAAKEKGPSFAELGLRPEVLRADRGDGLHRAHAGAGQDAAARSWRGAT